MTDPLRDLERRVDHLESKVDLGDAAIRAEIEAMRADIARLKLDEAGWVPILRFTPIERIVYGLVSAVLVTVILGLLSTVIARK